MKIIITESQLKVLMENEGQSFEEPLFFINKAERHLFFFKNQFYMWLYSIPDSEEKIDNGEMDPILFPRAAGTFQRLQRGTPPLLQVWTKSFQNKHRGSELLLGILRGIYDEENNKAVIDMMTVNPKYRRQGINSYMIQKLREKLNLSQDQIVFDDPTPEGEKFISAKKYE